MTKRGGICYIIRVDGSGELVEEKRHEGEREVLAKGRALAGGRGGRYRTGLYICHHCGCAFAPDEEDDDGDAP